MSENHAKISKKIFLPILAVFLSMLCAGVGLLVGHISPYSQDERRRTAPVEISDEEELVELITETKNFNNVYELKADIELSAPLARSMGSKTRPFNGTFRGNGFTVSFAEGVINTHPLFGYIGEEGIVTRLGYESKYEVGFTGDTHDCGGLALYNAGRIDNCYVDVQFETKYDVVVGGIAAYNMGRHAEDTDLSDSRFFVDAGDLSPAHDKGIYNCVVKASFARVDEEHRYNMGSVIGGAIGRNEGTVASVISKSQFTGYPEMLFSPGSAGMGTEDFLLSNQGIGAVVGVNLAGAGEGTVYHCIAVRPSVPQAGNVSGEHLILSDGSMLSTSICFYEASAYDDELMFRELRFNDYYWKRDGYTLDQEVER